MPLVTGFERSKTSEGKLQPTQVIATFKVFSRDGSAPVFQIDTGGSSTREHPGKQSQTFQLNRESAELLWRELGRAYGFK